MAEKKKTIRKEEIRNEEKIEINENVEEGMEEEKAEETLKEDAKKKQNKQVIIAVSLMIAVIAIIIITPFIYGHFFTKFRYINLDFQKTRLGEITFYSTRVPIVNTAPVTGNLISRENLIGDYAINFRNDPRKLEYIKVNTTFNNSDQVGFIKVNTVYIALDPEMEKCDDNSLALINLAGFLRDFVGLKVKSAVSDENASVELKIPYASCKRNEWNTVINIKSGNETKIEKTGINCYILTYKDCEITQVTEKFDFLILDGYMKYFEERKSWFDWFG